MSSVVMPAGVNQLRHVVGPRLAGPATSQQQQQQQTTIQVCTAIYLIIFYKNNVFNFLTFSHLVKFKRFSFLLTSSSKIIMIFHHDHFCLMKFM